MVMNTMSTSIKPSANPGNRESARINRSVKGKARAFSGFCLTRPGILLLLIVAAGCLVLPVSAYTTPDSIVVAGKLYVSDITLDPAVFFTGDTGTATFYVTNGNSNESIVASHATFGDKDIRVTSGGYDTSANIGPLQTRTFIFSVATDASEGSYYSTFSLSLRDADSLYYRTQVQVDNTPLVLTILDNPDTFKQDTKDSITVQIANPRKNDVKNVVLEVSGDGITATPSKVYIGALASGAEINRTVSITPGSESTIDITATYDNGDNHHSVNLEMPVSFAPDKKEPSPQMSNVQVKLENGIYHVTGDITNAGLENANGVAVTALSPAVPQDPYKSYIIGALKPDDFGSFEVTFSATGVTSIPLKITYKDVDGNIVGSQQDVTVTVADSTQAASSPSLLPVIGIILLVALVGGYLYVKRQKKQ
jgi:hypothetical protein